MAHTNSNDGGRECGSKPPNGGTRLEHSGSGERSRPEEWWEVEPDVGRVAHGVPARVPQLRALGNAIVPQIAQEIGQAIKELTAGGEACAEIMGGTVRNENPDSV